jgi:hypothetical protein
MCGHVACCCGVADSDNAACCWVDQGFAGIAGLAAVAAHETLILLTLAALGPLRTAVLQRKRQAADTTSANEQLDVAAVALGFTLASQCHGGSNLCIASSR